MELTEPLTMDSTLKPVIHQDIVNFYCDLETDLMCRICLARGQHDNLKMCNIFDASKQTHVSTMIMSCASVQVLEGDGLPATICQKCIARLNIAFQFKMQCENSDVKLRQYYGSLQQIQVTTDVPEFNISCKQDQNIYLLKQPEHNFNINNIPEETELAPLQPSPPVIEITNPNVEKKSDVPKKPAKQKIDKSREPKMHQCDSCGKTFNRREYLTQHIRIHTGEKPYHCHLCEKRFVNSGHLTTHMRTHTGIRPHTCSLCPKAFSTRQELQKHTMVHNGERPFVCKMCGKRFGSSSNLYSHFKHHTGEKNFTCEVCGKAFYTKQELKQHLVVHTGEKAFVCDFCNKRFSQIAHLRRHSKLHKQQM